MLRGGGGRQPQFAGREKFARQGFGENEEAIALPLAATAPLHQLSLSLSTCAIVELVSLKLTLMAGDGGAPQLRQTRLWKKVQNRKSSSGVNQHNEWCGAEPHRGDLDVYDDTSKLWRVNTRDDDAK